MGAFLPEVQPTQSGTVVPQSGAAADGDVALMQRVFGAAMARPDLVPESFMAYLVDFIQTSRLTIPMGQVQGYQSFLSTQVSVVVGAGSASLSLPTNTDASGSGPSLTSLVSGKYVILAGLDSSGGSSVTLTLSDGLVVNGGSGGSAAKAESVTLSSTTTITSTLAGHGGGAGGSITGAWLIAVRYDNA